MSVQSKTHHQHPQTHLVKITVFPLHELPKIYQWAFWNIKHVWIQISNHSHYDLIDTQKEKSSKNATMAHSNQCSKFQGVEVFLIYSVRFMSFPQNVVFGDYITISYKNMTHGLTIHCSEMTYLVPTVSKTMPYNIICGTFIGQPVEKQFLMGLNADTLKTKLAKRFLRNIQFTASPMTFWGRYQQMLTKLNMLLCSCSQRHQKCLSIDHDILLISSMDPYFFKVISPFQHNYLP